VEDGTVVPDGNIVGILPLQPDLQIMVLVHQLQEPVQQLLALLLRHAVDVLHMPAHGEDALPPGHGVCAHDGVDGLELGADVFDGAARLVIELEAGFLGDALEAGLVEGDGEGLEELLVGLADAVVELVA
jgi:hypothetical protein